MKKKVILLSLALMLLLTGVVSAAALWGKYKGYDIVRLMVNDVPVKVSDAPAFIFDNRTMIPIYLLQQAGIKYAWDQKTKTLDIQDIDESFVSEEEYIEMNKLMQSNRAFIYFMDQTDMVIATIDYIDVASDKSQNNHLIQEFIDKINIEGLNDWLFILNSNNVSDAYSFKQIINSIDRAKYYLIKGDLQNAFTQYMTAKSAMNILHNTIDSKYFGTFGVKNIEILSK